MGIGFESHAGAGDCGGGVCFCLRFFRREGMLEWLLVWDLVFGVLGWGYFHIWSFCIGSFSKGGLRLDIIRWG